MSDQVYEDSNPALQASAQRPTHGLPLADASALVQDRATADYFESAVAGGADAKAAANWVLGEVAAALNRAGIGIAAAPVSPAALAGLLAEPGAKAREPNCAASASALPSPASRTSRTGRPW
jgi:Asp-tRNA(Asn)/Glu-tRNA(Gln) amidotransferase B subunit